MTLKEAMESGRVVVLDNGGETVDRYTAVYPDGEGRGMSENPFHPQGFGQYIGPVDPAWIAETTDRRLTFEDLPPQVLKCIEMDYREYEEVTAVTL